MQLLQARLAELPVTQLADCIKTELDDNPALEAMQPDDHYDDHEDSFDDLQGNDQDDDFETISEREERQSQLDDALNNLGRDDEELPIYNNGGSYDNRNELAYEPGETFYDSLTMQMSVSASLTASGASVAASVGAGASPEGATVGSVVSSFVLAQAARVKIIARAKIRASSFFILMYSFFFLFC